MVLRLGSTQPSSEGMELKPKKKGNGTPALILRIDHPPTYPTLMHSSNVGGGKVVTATEDTSVLPAWRKAYVHLIGTGAGPFKTDSLNPLVRAYANESSLTDPNWKADFWPPTTPSSPQSRASTTPMASSGPLLALVWTSGPSRMGASAIPPHHLMLWLQ